jgi:hypothetical protein
MSSPCTARVRCARELPGIPGTLSRAGGTRPGETDLSGHPARAADRRTRTDDVPGPPVPR